MLRHRDKFVTELIINARGLKYERYVLDSEGNKIPRVAGQTAPELSQKTSLKEEKKTKLTGKALFKTELVTTERGVKYERLVKDANGNKIPLTPAEIAAKMVAITNSSERSSGMTKTTKYLNRKLRKEKKLCPVPRSLGAEMHKVWKTLIEEGREGTIRCTDFTDSGEDFRVVLTHENWFLIHMTSKTDDKWFFYNPEEHVSQPFILSEHKLGPGDHNVKFPNGFREMNPPVPDHNFVVPDGETKGKKYKKAKKVKKAA